MSSLSLLRTLALQQQFMLLQEACGAPQTPAEQVLLALACAQLGELDSARHALAGLDLATLDVDGRVDLAAVQLLQGELDVAQALLEAALLEAPEHALLLARLATCQLRRQQTAAARQLYERSLFLAPNILIYQQLLRLYLQDGAIALGGQLLTRAEAFWEGEQEHWPEPQAAWNGQQLRGLRLELWLAAEQYAAADAWLDEQQTTLDEEDYCGLLTGYAQRLAEVGRHAQAEDALCRGGRHYPEHPGLHQHRAELAELQGRTSQAIALLHRAIHLARQQQKPALTLRLKLVAVATQGHTALAREMVTQALEEAQALPPSGCIDGMEHAHWVFEAQVALAGVDVQEQRYAEAEVRYCQVLQDHPQLVPALQGLGQLYLQLGRLEEAVALFERVKVLDPVRGHSALINARRFPEDDATLHHLEMLARRPGPEGAVKPGLLLQLAAAWEKRKDHARAFALADEANGASRALLGYDPAAHRQACARIRHAFGRSLYEHRRGIGNDSTLPVFVLGMPRSGTTLVEQMLAGHSQIHGAGELGLVPGVIAGLERWERRVGSGRHYPDCVDDLDAKVIAGITGNLLKELQEYAPGALHVVDKLPHNFENIGLIKLLFPRARIISVRRDPRDIAISNYFTDYAAKHGGMGFAYDLTWIGEQLADHNLLMHHWNQLFPGEILEVRYEDVLDDPEREARRMLNYVGVAWEPQILNFSELQRPVKTASVWQVRQPLYKSSMARWARYETHLAPLLRGTNARIQWQPITDMVALPVPGLLETSVALYREEKLDDAEYHCKQLLHHLPEHAAATFMLGLVYVRKGHLDEGIALMCKAHELCPWNSQWRNDLARAYVLSGEPEKAALLTGKAAHLAPSALPHNEQEIDGEFSW
ncbi:tetratricopeptide repeat protein [Aeromonas sp. 3925]|uniref:tetratricopeptide repeat-containing sulfotransferase family protein n=1 Tax=Aeromonas genomosp. paramedia TaxID=3086176 RepID=UPI001FFC9406|nr:tetratricopeptide repeat-containing sulfotransferase family protein [Aeromonas genomosp. paramedia]MCK2085130.1 tetratricopeptide repeat protein [Aeromonas genomosp. paramedia]